VFPKYRTVVFVHGCYWHRHTGCKAASVPKSNTEFWTGKFAENTERDRRVQESLVQIGWRVLIVWQCELLGNNTLETIQNVALWLRQGGSVGGGEHRNTESLSDRKTLLATAENKVRYRIASYEEKKAPGDS